MKLSVVEKELLEEFDDLSVIVHNSGAYLRPISIRGEEVVLFSEVGKFQKALVRYLELRGEAEMIRLKLKPKYKKKQII